MGVRIYHPQFSDFMDRRSGIQFVATVLPDSGGREVASAVVDDPAPFLGRGFLLFPGEAVDALANLTVSELRALAVERGVELPSRAVKADIIALLEGGAAVELSADAAEPEVEPEVDGDAEPDGEAETLDE